MRLSFFIHNISTAVRCLQEKEYTWWYSAVSVFTCWPGGRVAGWVASRVAGQVGGWSLQTYESWYQASMSLVFLMQVNKKKLQVIEFFYNCDLTTYFDNTIQQYNTKI